ncbi:MAG: FtsH protease activity modulator HflK [Candidatus Cloacimonetes bacterium]|nr:FtsH protease activity modulator HflK [Candidatus Cloacimonadota bacterium]
MKEDVIEDFTKNLNLGNKKNHIKLVIIIALLLIFILPFFFTVDPEEMAVVQCFGKHVRTVEPGLNIRIPWGVEKVTKVKVKTVFKEEFGFRTLSPGVSARYSTRSYDEESLMLTGDLNIASVEWIVQYQIKDPVAYLFNVRNVTETIRNLSEATMRQIVGDRSIDEVIILNRQEIAYEVHELLQKLLDKYETGIAIKTVNLQNVVPPEIVQPAFNEVNSAMQEEERIVNEALQEYNRVIPQARGQARKTVELANGYAINRVNQAQGDAAKFISVYENYRKATAVTKQRMYLESMEEVLKKVDKVYIVDEKQQSLLPLLELGKGR